jgi:hypothetical protein
VLDEAGEFPDALAARKGLERRLACHSHVRQRLDDQVDQRAEGAEKQDDVDPPGIRAPPDEVDDRDSR